MCPSRCVICSATSPHAGGAYESAARRPARLLPAAASIVAPADNRMVRRLHHRGAVAVMVGRAPDSPLARESLPPRGVEGARFRRSNANLRAAEAYCTLGVATQGGCLAERSGMA